MQMLVMMTMMMWATVSQASGLLTVGSRRRRQHQSYDVVHARLQFIVVEILLGRSGDAPLDLSDAGAGHCFTGVRRPRIVHFVDRRQSLRGNVHVSVRASVSSTRDAVHVVPRQPRRDGLP